MDTTNNRSSTQTALVAINLSVVLWAITPMFAKLIPLAADQLIWLRSVIGLIGLIPLMLLLNKPLRAANRSQNRVLWLLGLLMTIHWVCFFQAVQLSTVGIALMALYSYPLLTIFLEPLFSRRPIQLADITLGLVLSAGIIIMLPEFSLANSMVQGVLFGLVAAVTFALRNLVSRHYAANVDSMTQMFYQTLAASLLLPALVWSSLDTSALDSEHWMQLGIMAWLFVLLPHTLFLFSLKHIPTKTVSMLATIQPIYGLIFSYFLLNEVPDQRTIVGGSLILLVATIETFRTQRHARG